MNAMTSDRSPETLQRKLRNLRTVSWLLAAALVFVGIAYAVLWADTKDLVVAEPSQNATQQPETPNLSTAPYMALGDEDAPITITEWTDFTCPYCGLFHRETLPTVIAEYVDTGKVRLELHDVTFIGDQAEDAAVAARAAGQQDRYFDYLFAMYGLGADGATPNLDAQQLTELAEGLELDAAAFERDLNDASLRQAVQASSTQAQEIGVSAVPFFLITKTGTLDGAQQLRGAQEIDAFRQVLDAELSKLGH